MTDAFEPAVRDFADQNSGSGCSESEIDSLLSQWPNSLPAECITFFRYCGHEVNNFMRGSHFAYSDAWRINEVAAELLRSCETEPTAEEVFCFVTHQGYLCSFFYRGEV